MKILLANFAGVGSNILKYLTWCLLKKDEDTIFFFYANKSVHDNSQLVPFSNLMNEMDSNIFYKLFKLPIGTTQNDLLYSNVLEMHYPTFLEKDKYIKYGLKAVPEGFSQYSYNFIFVSKVFKDPNLQYYRNIYNNIFREHLIPTEYLQNKIDSEMNVIRDLKIQGKRILAVFIRTPIHFTDYYNKNEKFNFSNVLAEIIEEMKDYDYILPITQIKQYYEVLNNYFSDNIIRLDRMRLSEMEDWKSSNITADDFEKEVTTAMIDIYLGSQCDMVMGGSSNLVFSALILNAENKFKEFKCLEGKDTG
jgi:hypothetical protein